MQKVTSFLVQKRYYLLVIMLILTGVALFFTTKVEVNYDMTEYLPKTSLTKQGLNTFEKEFLNDTSNGNLESFLNLTFKNPEKKTVLPFYIVVLAVFIALVILIITSSSYVEPFLFLITILIAVILNKGTNLIFPNISNITNSIVAILQMALSMDYSIMLMNRYREECVRETNKVLAMKKALFKSFKSIFSSSLTTIVGLLALTFMSFLIGKDLGLVLAKGVFLSLITVFTCLPGLILLFDKLITKTAKKSPHLQLNFLGKLAYKSRFVVLLLFPLIFLMVYHLKDNLSIFFTTSNNKSTNDIVIIYPTSKENIIQSYLKDLSKNDKIVEILNYETICEKPLTLNELTTKIKTFIKEFTLEDYLGKMLYYHYYHPKEDNKMTLLDFIKFFNYDINNIKEFQPFLAKIDLKKLQEVTNKFDVIESNKAYSQEEMQVILANLNFSLDKEFISLIYMYHGSITDYQANYTLSIFEFSNYLNQVILKDNRFELFLDERMQTEILNLNNQFMTLKNIFVKKNYSQLILKTNYEIESQETFNFLKETNNYLERKVEDFYLVGDSLMAYELNETFSNELNLITILTIVFIFLVIIFTFKNWFISFILVMLIQTSVYLTMGILSLSGSSYFIAILVVESILMGATIDYAILYTSYYREARNALNVKESLIKAYNNSFHAIATSSSILIVSTLVVGLFASDITSKICLTISVGTICSVFLTIFFLPSLLAACDKLIIKKNN